MADSLDSDVEPAVRLKAIVKPPLRWTAWVSVGCSCCHLGGGGGVGLLWGEVAVALGEPFGAVELGPGGDGCSEVVDGVVEFDPQALLLRVRMNRSAQPLVSGSPT